MIFKTTNKFQREEEPTREREKKRGKILDPPKR